MVSYAGLSSPQARQESGVPATAHNHHRRRHRQSSTCYIEQSQVKNRVWQEGGCRSASGGTRHVATVRNTSHNRLTKAHTSR